MAMPPPPRASAALLLAGLATLGACKQQPADPASVDPGTVASKVSAADPKPQPGRWETTIRMDAVEMPNLPPEARAMMQHQAGTARMFATCLTPDQAARPAAGLFNQGASGCTYDQFTMADGRLDGSMTCQQGAQTIHITLAGNYGPDMYEVHTRSRINLPGGQPLTSSVSMTAHRAGDCRGDEPAPKTSG